MQSYNALIGILHPGVESFSEIQHHPYRGGGRTEKHIIYLYMRVGLCFKNEDHIIIPIAYNEL